MSAAPVITKSIVESIGEAVLPHVRTSLRVTASGCPDGMNSGDIGSSFRTDIVRTLPGLFIPGGSISAEEAAVRYPKNTTWLKVRTSAGSFDSTVNCASLIQSGLYKLSSHESPYVGRSGVNPSLFEEQSVFTHDELQLMWAIEWKHLWDAQRKHKEGIKATIRLLYGAIDTRKRQFHAKLEHDIVFVDTRLDAATSGTSKIALGPEPVLQPKKRV